MNSQHDIIHSTYSIQHSTLCIHSALSTLSSPSHSGPIQSGPPGPSTRVHLDHHGHGQYHLIKVAGVLTRCCPKMRDWHSTLH